MILFLLFLSLPQTEVQLNVSREEVQEHEGPDKYWCECVAWNKRGEKRSQSAVVQVACKKKPRLILCVYFNDIFPLPFPTHILLLPPHRLIILFTLTKLYSSTRHISIATRTHTFSLFNLKLGCSNVQQTRRRPDGVVAR